jgi:hypothetical protein
MNTQWSSVVIAVVLAGCASKAPQGSQPVPTPTPSASAVATTAKSPPPPVVPTPVATAAAKVEPKHAAKLSVKRITLARGVDHREPVDPSASFDAKAQKVYAFVELDNPERLPGEITVEFQPPSKKYEVAGGVRGSMGRVTLGVGEASRWRTWAFTRQAHEVGAWTAIVRDERGHELARETFDVT